MHVVVGVSLFTVGNTWSWAWHFSSREHVVMGVALFTVGNTWSWAWRFSQ